MHEFSYIHGMRNKPSPLHRHYARAMRHDSTLAENMLWQQLRGRQMGGVKFRRQVPLDGYIVDFVSFEARLIIEVDGGQHADSLRDRLRDNYFVKCGFHTLRFWNDDVVRNLDGVCREVISRVQRQGE